MTVKLPNIMIFIALILVVLISELLFFNQGFISDLTFLFYSKGILKTGFYVTSYLFGLIFVASLLFVKNKYIFLLGFLTIGISYLANLNYKFINGKGFGLSELQTMLHESNKFTQDVWSSYSSYITNGILITIAIIVFVILMRKLISKHNLFISNTFFYANIFIAFAFMLVVTFLTANTHSRFPTPAHLITTLTYYVTNAPYHGERAEVTSTPTKKQLFDNIIWIVDESIAGNYLSINGYEKDTTPYLKSINDQYINLGLAASGANCSAESNLILASGIQLNELPDKEFTSLKRPNIFQYAKKAGYQTHYISGQSNDMVFQNYMTSFDLEYLDSFYQPNASTDASKFKEPEEDLIAKTSKVLKESPKNFIYIVKRGAHFHWEGKYPKDRAFFQPTLKPNDNLIEKNKEKAHNSYANNIKYTVDDFFKAFLNETNLLADSKTLIVYTSDHGQSILEGNSNGTHCDGQAPNKSQGIVPLILITDPENPVFADVQPNKHSHFEIFPTTLRLMGYEGDYGMTLFDKPEINQKFFSGGIFGRTNYNKSSISH